jgi:hypothetical protein
MAAARVVHNISRNLSDQDLHRINALEDTEFWKKARSCLRASLTRTRRFLRRHVQSLGLDWHISSRLGFTPCNTDCLGEMIPPENPQIVHVFRSVEDVTEVN